MTPEPATKAEPDFSALDPDERAWAEAQFDRRRSYEIQLAASGVEPATWAATTEAERGAVVAADRASIARQLADRAVLNLRLDRLDRAALADELRRARALGIRV